MLTLFATASKAQEAVPVIQDLPNDQFVVRRNGKEYLSLDAAKVRELQEQKAENDSLKLQLQAADNQIADQAAKVQALTEKVAVKEQERDRARGDLQEAKGLIAQQRATLDQEIAFRHESVQMIPKGNSHGLWGHVLDALNSQEGQLTFKVGLQTLQTWRLFTRCQ